MEDGRARLVSRNRLDWTAQFGRIAEAAAGLRTKTAILDGEIVVFRADGTSDFNVDFALPLYEDMVAYANIWKVLALIFTFQAFR